MSQPEIIGTWLVEDFWCEIDTKVRTYPFGPNPRGVLIILENGRMAAVFSARTSFQISSELDKARAYDNSIGYSGRYRLEAPDRFVTQVDVSSWPHWFGTTQGRTYSINGNHLEIISDPVRGPNGENVIVKVSLVREVA
ncbi:MAG TPA: lipocalin-like domain-containing protein [Bradyrhizobium sp.]|uniref:lipocalin-like domain-containing protein n=1 Tax=Bradyrhizobium sp. TaxID=376 RepID=UPI002D7FEB77|nr:lipocalin-like domain-containing protein [Bradyrhizobium sp.]HET7888815.1 lipocalin-like domain-containing protein [Bradyrhizobium sp.]